MTLPAEASVGLVDVSSCRGCGKGGLAQIIALGPTPLANALPADERERIPRYSLDLVRCPGCSLVQLAQAVSPKRLFSEYIYFSSFSDTLLRHADALAD